MVQAHLIAFLIVLGIMGVIDSAFIFWHHLKKKPLACPVNTDCNAVIESKWGSFFGIKNEILGIFYYAAVGLLALFLFKNNNPALLLFLLVISLGALIFSIFLVYVQKYILKNYCFYCLISAFINLLIFLNVLLL